MSCVRENSPSGAMDYSGSTSLSTEAQGKQSYSHLKFSTLQTTQKNKSSESELITKNQVSITHLFVEIIMFPAVYTNCMYNIINN